MTAYTSTQTGNFSSASTWGGSGYPSANGDTWTIASGHTVTYDVSTALSSGFEDCTVDAGGRFQFASGTRSIRFQGNVAIYGDWIQGAGHTVFLAGGNGHIFQLRNPSETHVKKFTGSQSIDKVKSSREDMDSHGQSCCTSGYAGMSVESQPDRSVACPVSSAPAEK